MEFSVRYCVAGEGYPRTARLLAEKLATNLLGQQGGRWKVDSMFVALWFQFNDGADAALFGAHWNALVEAWNATAKTKATARRVAQ